ncbi:adenylate kinase [Violaceomyces palustris]|uniref:Adenylate kinase n=1 Tax=Violaceomyces palustris TaxID=1673888 RepID=A0ACD0NSP2_9BASI|nr:adenylate kinase [Violaceomyces palustris]
MLIVGCPGSGKGTQSSRLLKKYDFNVITAGDLLRHHIEQGTPIGRRASEVIRSGGLMPDEIMMELVGKEVEALEDQDWLLDGFPRTLGQAILLDRSLEERGRPLDLVVNLDVPEDVILERILNRWTHLPSGRVYNLSFNPPKVAGKDDVTGEDLVQREDDNAETFSKRLRSFHQLTEPMLDHYREKSKRTSRGGKEKEEELFVNLRGSTSDEIFPHLDELVRTRFPDLVKSLSRRPCSSSSSSSSSSSRLKSNLKARFEG